MKIMRVPMVSCKFRWTNPMNRVVLLIPDFSQAAARFVLGLSQGHESGEAMALSEEKSSGGAIGTSDGPTWLELDYWRLSYNI